LRMLNPLPTGCAKGLECGDKPGGGRHDASSAF
jgi:hypothetical protein